MHTHFQTFDMRMLGFLSFLFIIILYMTAVFISNRKLQKWQIYRSILFSAGIVCIALAFIGPIADHAHMSFRAHMVTHLLLGMLGPLLISLSAPMTLMLRTIPINLARQLSKILKSTYVQFICHPITTTIFNIGGLWLLYTTDIYSMMHTSFLIYIIVHLHVFLAGYVFTISMIYIDPTPHRTSFSLRACMLVIAMAGHSILSKWIYANPPTGVGQVDAELGGMLMYYAGDVIDLMIVILFCSQYFRGRKNLNKKIPLLS